MEAPPPDLPFRQRASPQGDQCRFPPYNRAIGGCWQTKRPSAAHGCGPTEENAVGPSHAQPIAAMRSLLEECGYSGTRLESDYTVGDTRFPLVGFAVKP